MLAAMGGRAGMLGQVGLGRRMRRSANAIHTALHWPRERLRCPCNHALPLAARLATPHRAAPQARSFYSAGLVAGLRNDVTDEVLAMRQRWRLADIRLEEYAFVVLSRIIGQLEEQVCVGVGWGCRYQPKLHQTKLN